MTTMEVYWKESYNIILIMGRWAWGSSSTAALCESSRAIRVGKRKKKSPYILLDSRPTRTAGMMLFYYSRLFFGQAMDKSSGGVFCTYVHEIKVGVVLGF